MTPVMSPALTFMARRLRRPLRELCVMKNRIAAYLVLTIAFLVQASSANAQNGSLISTAERISGDRFTVFARTPMGATVYAVNRPNSQMLSTIDAGLTDLFAVARKNGYRRNLSYSDYTIFIAKPDRLKDIEGKYSPDIAVGAAQYAGSIYDKGGYIYAAGMVTSFAPGAFLIAEHTKDLNRVRDIVRFEGEHIVLYYNDRRRFLATQDHSRGGGHPILQ
jgi:hypothetical protein